MIQIDPHWNFTRQEFAQCDFIVSDPVVSYRETVTEESNQSCSLAEMGVLIGLWKCKKLPYSITRSTTWK